MLNIPDLDSTFLICNADLEVTFLEANVRHSILFGIFVSSKLLIQIVIWWDLNLIQYIQTCFKKIILLYLLQQRQ